MSDKQQISQSPAKSEPGEIQTKVRETADQIRSAATDRVESARSAAESAKTRAAERVRKLGGVVRRVGEHMRIEEQNFIADRANDASQRFEAVADYIADAELSDMLRDAEDVARKRPALIFGGTFLLGLAMGRLLKTPAGEVARSKAGDVPAPIQQNNDQSNNGTQASASSGTRKSQSSSRSPDTGARR